MHIETLSEIRESTKKLVVPHKHKKSLSGLEAIGVIVTEHVGTMGFFFIIFGWTVIWLSWNTIGPKQYRFDPAPAFVLWLFISNLIQLHLMPLIMVGQNIQDKHADIRSQHDYETDKKAEREIEAILAHLEEQHETIERLLKKIETLEEKTKK